ncbi:MAG: VanW family protein [bacterium]|nr:VanW family protein [bacterium]
MMKQIFKGIFIIIFGVIIVYTGTGYAEERDNYLVLSSFSTSVADQTEAVKMNISLAARRINGTVILPGTVFSFNETVGEGTAKNGYVNGLVLYRGETRMEPGGGLCQASSTVYNALLMAGVRIVERHRHFQPVTYVPLGLDATIKYGKKDLRMKNPHKQRLIISSTMNDKSLIIVIRGERKLPFTYTIDTEEDIITIPFAKQENETERIRPGISVYVYRKKFKGNKLLESFLMYKDFYPPVYLK